MKRILFAIVFMLASISMAVAGNQYSQEQPSLLDEILGTNDATWTTSPQPQPNLRLRGRHRRFSGFYTNHESVHQVQPSLAYSRHDVSQSIVAYGHQLQAAGFRVSEHPAFGGVHAVHHGWAHYAGRAIDVNIGVGMQEAYNSSARHRFDLLAASARAAGYTVLWRVAGHYDHIHIQR